MSDPAEGWRRAALASAARVLVSSVAIVALSVLTSSTIRQPGLLAVVATTYVVVWMVIYVLYFRWQIKAIRRSGFPLIRGVEALLIGTVLFITIFAKTYLLVSMGDAASFSEPLDHFTAYYFAVTVLATVGFGDISPSSVTARSISMVQMVLDLAIIAIAVRLVTMEVRNATARRKAAANP